jgi:hypothetical protein
MAHTQLCRARYSIFTKHCGINQPSNSAMGHPATYTLPDPKLQLQLPDSLAVADQVVVVFCDCCAAG